MVKKIESNPVTCAEKYAYQKFLRACARDKLFGKPMCVKVMKREYDKAYKCFYRTQKCIKMVLPNHGKNRVIDRARIYALISSLSDCIKFERTDLHQLVMRNTSVMNDGLIAMKERFPTSQITHLDLGGNDIDDNGIDTLCHIMSSSKDLKVLVLSNNKFTTSGKLKLIMSIDKNIQIKF